MARSLSRRPPVFLLVIALAVTVLGAEGVKDAEQSNPRSIDVTSRRQQEEAALERALD